MTDLLSVIIPAYNEAENVAPAAERILGVAFDALGAGRGEPGVDGALAAVGHRDPVEDGSGRERAREAGGDGVGRLRGGEEALEGIGSDGDAEGAAAHGRRWMDVEEGVGPGAGGQG